MHRNKHKLNCSHEISCFIKKTLLPNENLRHYCLRSCYKHMLSIQYHLSVPAMYIKLQENHISVKEHYTRFTSPENTRPFQRFSLGQISKRSTRRCLHSLPFNASLPNALHEREVCLFTLLRVRPSGGVKFYGAVSRHTLRGEQAGPGQPPYPPIHAPPTAASSLWLSGD